MQKIGSAVVHLGCVRVRSATTASASCIKQGSLVDRHEMPTEEFASMMVASAFKHTVEVIRWESPKHRVSLELHMNYYVHRKTICTICTISMEHCVT